MKNKSKGEVRADVYWTSMIQLIQAGHGDKAFAEMVKACEMSYSAGFADASRRRKDK